MSPFKIRKLRNKPLYKVYNPETGKVYSNGSTKKDAKSQVKLLYMIEKNGGELPSEKLEGGASFFDWVKKNYKKTRDRLFKRGYSKTSQQTLSKYGDCKIVKGIITRTPISGLISGALQALTFGKWLKKTRKEGLDKLFHLSLLVNVECPSGNIATIVMEKNEVVNISDRSSIGLNDKTEYLEVPGLLDSNIQLDELIGKTREYMGERRFFTYDAFKNNCQFFIDDILSANDINTYELHNFLFQDLRNLYESMPKYVPKTMKFLTNTGAFVSRLIGRGKVEDVDYEDYLEKKTEDDYSEAVKNVIEKISFPGGDTQVLGSMSFRSQLYTTDYDCFQVVKASSIQQIKTQFQSIVRGIQKDPDLTIADIKLGSFEPARIIREDARIGTQGKLINYDHSKSIAKAEKLREMGLIKDTELDQARELLIEKPNVEELKAIIKKLRFNIIRWKPSEVLAGKKDFRGVEYSLEEGFETKSLFKMDVIAYIHGKYTEFSIIYDLRLNGRRLNYVGIDTLKTLEDDMKYYAFVGNWFKYLKRKFSYLNYILKYKKLSPTQKKKLGNDVIDIIDILNSDVGILYTIVQDLDVIELMLEDLGRVPNERMKAIIDHTIDRMSNVFSVNEFLIADAEIMRKISELREGADAPKTRTAVRETNNKEDFLRGLKEIKSTLEEIISVHTKKLMDGEGIKGGNSKYIPDVLSPADKKKQAKSIKEGTPRPKVAYRNRRSKWTIKADKYFGDKKSVAEMAEKLGVEPAGLEKIIEKGRGAYYSSGSRPNQTAESWGRARLYAVLFGSKKARKVDKDIIEEYNIPLVNEEEQTGSGGGGYIICITTYNRVDICRKKTLTTLKNNNISPDKIFLVVHNKEQADMYKNGIPSELYNSILITNKNEGIYGQINWITRHFKEGQQVLKLDDDISSFKKLRGDKLVKMNDIENTIKKGFELCEQNGYKLFGLYPSPNAFYMKGQKEYTTDLRFIVGAFMGLIIQKKNIIDLSLKIKGDYEYTINSYKLNGGIIRFNTIAVDYHIAKSEGERRKTMIKDAEILIKKHPTLVRINKNREGEILLNKKEKKEGNGVPKEGNGVPKEGNGVPKEGNGVPKEGNGGQMKGGSRDLENTPLDKLPMRLSIRDKSKYERMKKEILEELETGRKIPPVSKEVGNHNSRGRIFGYKGRTITFGWGDTRRGIKEYAKNKQYAELFKKSVALGEVVVPKGYRFNCITINEDVITKPHTDTKNNGNSVIIVLSNAEGKNSGYLNVEKGKTGKMVSMDIKDKPILMNGYEQTHSTAPYKLKEGQYRYTFVFYRQKFQGKLGGLEIRNGRLPQGK